MSTSIPIPAYSKKRSHARSQSDSADDFSIQSNFHDDADALPGKQARKDDLLRALKKSEVIKLNVGGTEFLTTLQTLSHCEPDQSTSFLENLLHSGSVVAKLLSDGTLFVDRNAQMFPSVLDYLRSKQLNLEELNRSELKMLRSDAEAYLLPSLVAMINRYLDQSPLSEVPSSPSSVINIQDFATSPPPPQGGFSMLYKVATKDGDEQWKLVSGCAVRTDSAKEKFVIKILNAKATPPMIKVGITPTGSTDANQGWFWHLCHGSLYSSLDQISNKPYSGENMPKPKIGDCIEVTLFDKKMSFSLNGVDLGVAFECLPEIVVPAVCLYYPGSSVELLQPTDR